MAGLNFYLKLVETVLFVVFFVLFLVMINDIWNKFTAGLTWTGIAMSDDGIAQKRFPFFTICPWPAFRSSGFYFKEEDYLKNTFELIDVFNNVSYQALLNRSQYEWKELRGLFYGRCYTVKSLVTVCPLPGYLLISTSNQLLLYSWAHGTGSGNETID